MREVRFEVLRLHGVWVLCEGPSIRPQPSYQQAVESGIASAKAHAATDGGRATVNAWIGGQETLVFETAPKSETP